MPKVVTTWIFITTKIPASHFLNSTTNGQQSDTPGLLTQEGWWGRQQKTTSTLSF